MKAYLIIVLVLACILFIETRLKKSLDRTASSSEDPNSGTPTNHDDLVWAKKAGQKIKLVKRITTGVLLAVLILVPVFNSFYTVAENEQVVVTMFGKVIRTETAGLHWKLPLIEEIEPVDMTAHGCSIGYTIEGSTQTYGNNENPQMITNDFNMVDVDFYMEYQTIDPVQWLYRSSTPEQILTNIAMSCIRATIAEYNVDDVMTTAKSEIQQKISERLKAQLEEQNIGITLLNIMIQDVEPPTAEVTNAFKSVETAKQAAQAAINDAEKDRNTRLPKAEADADATVQKAEATKAARIAEAEGEVAKYERMFEEYTNFPLITKQRLFFEKMEEIIPGARVIVISNNDGSTYKVLPLDTLTGE